MTDYAHGFIGLVKALTGIDRADAETIGFRRYACIICPKRVRGWCSVCHCKLKAKTVVKSEHCPKGYW
jgi:hypothetical protein